MYSNIADMARWAQIHLGIVDVDEQFARVVQQSHVPGPDSRYGNVYYGAGWAIDLVNGNILHNGMAPGYSTTVSLFHYRDTAVVLLINLKYADINQISNLILDATENGVFNILQTDFYASMDLMSTVTALIGIITTIMFAVFVLRLIKKTRSGYRIGFKITFKRTLLLLLPLALTVYFIGGYILLPIYMNMSMAQIMLYAPASAVWGDIALIATAVCAWLFWFAKVLVQPKKDSTD